MLIKPGLIGYLISIFQVCEKTRSKRDTASSGPGMCVWHGAWIWENIK